MYPQDHRKRHQNALQTPGLIRTATCLLAANKSRKRNTWLPDYTGTNSTAFLMSIPVDQQWKNTKWNVTKKCFGAATQEFQKMLKADDQTGDEATCHQGKSRWLIINLLRSSLFFFSWGLCRVIVFPLDKASVMCIRVLYIYIIYIYKQFICAGFTEGLDISRLYTLHPSNFGSKIWRSLIYH